METLVGLHDERGIVGFFRRDGVHWVGVDGEDAIYTVDSQGRVSRAATFDDAVRGRWEPRGAVLEAKWTMSAGVIMATRGDAIHLSIDGAKTFREIRPGRSNVVFAGARPDGAVVVQLRGSNRAASCANRRLRRRNLGDGRPHPSDVLFTGMAGGYGMPALGTILAGTYRLDHIIGSGGMGTVYAASHTRLPRRFAVKLLAAEVSVKRDLFERFRREAEIASAAGHENIVEAFDFNLTDDGIPYIVMELLEGESLRSRLDTRGALSVRETVIIADQVASALAAAHASGIVHRDLKPENVFLCRRGERDDFVKVLDFGVSKLLHSQTISTDTGVILGTPQYMAPEQATQAHGQIDRRTDVFALGTILYECLAGGFAFEGPTPIGVIYSVVHSVPPPLRARRPEVPEPLERLIERAMSKRPEDRQSDCAELRRELQQACSASGLETLRSAVSSYAPTLALERTPMIAVRPSLRQDVETLAQASVTARSEFTNASSGSGRRRFALGAAGITVIAVVLVLLLLARRNADSSPPMIAEGASGGSPHVGATVELRLRVIPTSARVEVDGVATKSDALVLSRSNDAHELVVSASGYVTERRTFRALADGDLVVELRPEAAIATPAPVSETGEAGRYAPTKRRAETPARRAPPSPSRAPRASESPSPAPARSLGPVERNL